MPSSYNELSMPIRPRTEPAGSTPPSPAIPSSSATAKSDTHCEKCKKQFGLRNELMEHVNSGTCNESSTISSKEADKSEISKSARQSLAELHKLHKRLRRAIKRRYKEEIMRAAATAATSQGSYHQLRYSLPRYGYPGGPGSQAPWL